MCYIALKVNNGDCFCNDQDLETSWWALLSQIQCWTFFSFIQLLIHIICTQKSTMNVQNLHLKIQQFLKICFLKWLILGHTGLTWIYQRQYARTRWQLWDSNSRPLDSEAWPLTHCAKSADNISSKGKTWIVLLL